MNSKSIGSNNIASQMSLSGLGTKSQQEHNYFFALLPDDAVRSEISRVADELNSMHAFNGAWVSKVRYHLTLHPLGQFPDVRSDLVSRALNAAGKIQARAFDITLDQLVCLDSKTGKYPCVLTPSIELPELKNFWLLLKNNLLALKLGENLVQHFTPGITLLHNRQPIKETLAVVPVHWHVTDFVLIESQVGKTEHKELGRWPLLA